MISPRAWNAGFNNMSFSDFYKYLELALKVVNNNVHDSEVNFINKTLLIQDIVMKETMKSLTQILNVYTTTQDGAVGNLDIYVDKLIKLTKILCPSNFKHISLPIL